MAELSQAAPTDKLGLVLVSKQAAELQSVSVLVSQSDNVQDAFPVIRIKQTDIILDGVGKEAVVELDKASTSIERRQFHIIANDAASRPGTSSRVVKESIIPLLEAAHLASEPNIRMHVVPETAATANEGDAVNVASILRDAANAKPGQEPVIIVCGGDGTTHQLLQSISDLSNESPEQTSTSAPLSLVLVPTGSANALYASFYPPTTANGGAEARPSATPFSSLLSAVKYIASSSAISTVKHEPPAALRPLSTLRVRLEPSTTSTPLASKPHSNMIAHVVASTSLHASILHSSEELRATHPGPERFGIAAQKNLTNFYPARVRLLPFAGKVQRYDIGSRQLQDVPVSSVGDVQLEGPFSYFASALVDRFEPQFVIAPLRDPRRAPTGSVDVVVIRPLRDPEVKAALGPVAETDVLGLLKAIEEGSEDVLKAAREASVARLVALTPQMYDGGKHIDATFGEGEKTQESAVVEYYRCGGFEWEALSPLAELVCIDGTVISASKVRCEATAGGNGDQGSQALAAVNMWT